MATPIRTLRRLGIFAVGGAVAGGLMDLILHLLDGHPYTLYVDLIFPMWIFFAPTIAAGVASWLGFEIGQRAGRAGGTRRIAAALPRWSAAVFAFGLLCGVALWLGSRIVTITGSVLAPSVFGFALASGYVVGRASRPGEFRGGLVGILFGLLCGLGVALGLVTMAVISPPRCPPHAWCVLPDPLYLLQFDLVYATVIGLWLGIAVWLALGLGLRLAPVPSQAE